MPLIQARTALVRTWTVGDTFTSPRRAGPPSRGGLGIRVECAGSEVRSSLYGPSIQARRTRPGNRAKPATQPPMNATGPDRPSRADARSSRGGLSDTEMPMPKRYTPSAVAGKEYANSPQVNFAHAASPGLSPQTRDRDQRAVTQAASITTALTPHAIEAADPYAVGSVASGTSTPRTKTDAKAIVPVPALMTMAVILPRPDR